MIRHLIACTCLLLVFPFSDLYSQAPPKAMNAGEIRQALNRLGTLGSVMFVAAHPDDENTRVLSWLANERNFRTVYLSITRGDGGQNLIGSEQSEELGMIRTQELLQARKIDGAEQFFTSANDFGFSKNPEETFSIWNRDSVLKDVVYAIRKFQPDVIINRFTTTGEGGHGHHTASAILSIEAFKAAADPLRYPEQLKYVSTWQARRIFLNTFIPRGQPQTDMSGALKLDVGGYNPLLGISYGEMASASRSMHKSQGFGVAVNRGKNIEYFRLVEGDTTTTDLFSGINTGWSREAPGPQLHVTIRKAIAEFSDAHPEKSIPVLLEILKQIRALDEGYWKIQKEQEVTSLLAACSGLWMELNVKKPSGVPGDSFSFTFSAISRMQPELTLQKISVLQWDTLLKQKMPVNEITAISKGLILDKNKPYSGPYWLQQPTGNGRYHVADPLQTGKPWNDPAVTAIATVKFQDQLLNFSIPATHKWTDPVIGERIRPVEILPAVSIIPSETVIMFPTGEKRKFSVTAECISDSISGTLKLHPPAGWMVEPASAPLKLTGSKQVTTEFTIYHHGKQDSAGTAILNITFEAGGKTYNHTVRNINYEHIPPLIRLQQSSIRLVNLELKATVKKIGYIEGAGDAVAECLRQAGFEVTLLNNESIMKGDLSAYDAIVTGIRAYNTVDEMAKWYDPLMRYVENGGTLISQYNTGNSISNITSPIGPYPFKITRDRVTVETAPVVFNDPGHFLLKHPNMITETDFQGWVQERGLYFAGELAPEYKTIFTMSDPGEKPLSGSLIIAQKGKGYFMYTGISFFRQLPAGVPGAWRLFVNLLHAGK